MAGQSYRAHPETDTGLHCSSMREKRMMLLRRRGGPQKLGSPSARAHSAKAGKMHPRFATGAAVTTDHSSVLRVQKSLQRH